MSKNHAMDIGTVIREIRQAKGLTLEEVAYNAGTDGGNLSRIERGMQRCISELLERIAVALNVTVSELYLRAEAGRADPEKQTRLIQEVYAVAPLSPEDLKQAALFAKFKKLTKDNQEIVAEFVQTLLRHQRQK